MAECAQTGNIVLGAIASSEGNWATASRYLWPLLVFIVGVLAAQTLMIAPMARAVRRPYRTLLALEILALVLIAALLDSVPAPWPRWSSRSRWRHRPRPSTQWSTSGTTAPSPPELSMNALVAALARRD